jgi:hypothetical protein
MPIGLTELRLLIWQKQHLKQMDFEDNYQSGTRMIFGELSKTTKRDVFLMPGFLNRTKITIDYGENW